MELACRERQDRSRREPGDRGYPQEGGRPAETRHQFCALFITGFTMSDQKGCVRMAKRA
jgi:hypothetical protein